MTALDAYSAPARAAPSVWRLILMLGVVFCGLVAVGVGIGAVSVALGRDGRIALADGFATPVSALLLLATFLIWRPAIWLAMRLFARRPYGTLFSPRGVVDWGGFLSGLMIAAGFSAAASCLALALVGAPIWTGGALLPWLGFAALAIPLIYIQSTAEEILFRGLILQHMAARFGAFWAWALVPSILFGLLHWNPAGYGAAVWMVLLITGLTGLVFALVTAATGNLGLAMGLHFGLNVYALVFIAPNEAFSALALAQWPDSETSLIRLLVVDLGTLLIGSAIAWRIYRRSLRAA